MHHSCCECGEWTDEAHPLVNSQNVAVGHLCDDCFNDCETEESLAILSMERLAYS